METALEEDGKGGEAAALAQTTNVYQRLFEQKQAKLNSDVTAMIAE